MVCGPGPGGFSFTWDDIDPDGTQRQLNKGNLALHVEKNQKHRERVKAAADKASRKAGGGGRLLSYFQTRRPALLLLPLLLPPLLLLTLPLLLLVVELANLVVELMMLVLLVLMLLPLLVVRPQPPPTATPRITQNWQHSAAMPRITHRGHNAPTPAVTSHSHAPHHTPTTPPAATRSGIWGG